MLWSGPTDDTSDCTPALNAVITAITGYGDITLDFPAGQFVFQSQPLPLPRMRIRGQGKLATVFHKRFDGGAMFYMTGHSGGGIVIEELACLCYAEHAPGYMAFLKGTVSYQPDESVLRQIWCSSSDGGLWYQNVVLDGLARSSPQGIRDVLIEDCEFFNAQNGNLWLRDCVGLKVRGTGIFGGAGPTSGCGIYITGGAAVGQQSTRCYFDDVNNNGQLNIRNSFECSFRGTLGSLNTDGSSHWRIDASCSGPRYNNLTNSKVDFW
jgi:hypothetical protein